MNYKEYPKFKRGGVQKKYIKLPKGDKEIITRFLEYISITSKAQTRIENNKRALTHFRIIIGKSLSKITLEDLRGYLTLLNNSKNTNATQNDFKASIKRFLKWHYKDWSDRFNNLSDIRLYMRMNEEKINADTLLKKEEIEKIMKAEPKLYWKTFFITLYESGLRPKELRTLPWQNVKLNIDGDISEISVYATKTNRTRAVYVKEATLYLKRLYEQRKGNNPLVFPAPQDTTRPLSKSTVNVWINRLSKKAIGRNIFPYILRHSRATELYTNAGISDKIAQKFLGHSKSMSDVYTHLSNKDIKEALGKTIYNLEEISPEKKHVLEKQIERLKKDSQARNRLIYILAKDNLKNLKSREKKEVEAELNLMAQEMRIKDA